MEPVLVQEHSIELVLVREHSIELVQEQEHSKVLALVHSKELELVHSRLVHTRRRHHHTSGRTVQRQLEVQRPPSRQTASLR